MTHIMTHISLIGVCLLLYCSSSALGMSCQWLQPGQDVLGKTILRSFKTLRDGRKFPTQCFNGRFPSNIDFVYNTTRIEEALFALLEVTNHVNNLYSNISPSLGYSRATLNLLLMSLDQQTKNLRDCTSIYALNSTMQMETTKAIHAYFKTLKEISLEKDSSQCARDIIEIEIKKQLQLTAQLSSF